MSYYLNNLGIINAMGCGKTIVANHLLAGISPGMQPYEALFAGNITWVGQVTDELLAIPASLSAYDCRNNQLLITAYAQIADDVEKLKQQFGSERVGIILGTSTSGIHATEIAFIQLHETADLPAHYDYRQQEIGAMAEFLARYADVSGPSYVISTACSASGKAIAAGQRLLANDVCDAVIVGGSDSLCQLTLNGFNALKLVSDRVCRPFSADRNGITIGEGAALFIMSKQAGEIKLTGTGESSDAYHASAPEPDGRGAALAMQQAMHMANLTEDKLGYINTHGTASQQNDQAEACAIERLCPSQPYCSSTKPLTGHTLGAAGAQDLALCWLLLSSYNPHRLLPKQAADITKDKDMATINLLTSTQTLQKLVCMSNSFAFGGNNVSLIIERGN